MTDFVDEKFPIGKTSGRLIFKIKLSPHLEGFLFADCHASRCFIQSLSCDDSKITEAFHPLTMLESAHNDSGIDCHSRYRTYQSLLAC